MLLFGWVFTLTERKPAMGFVNTMPWPCGAVGEVASSVPEARPAVDLRMEEFDGHF